MSFAFMPVYTGDYQRDTRHLSMMEHGAYFGLLMHCWDQKGPVPLDERRIFAICNARSSEEMGAVRNILAEFFVRMDDGFYNKRMSDEIRRAEAVSGARAQAGKIGGLARAANDAKRIRTAQANAKQLLDKSQAIAKQELVPPPPPPVLKTKPLSAARTDLPAGFAAFWKFYPHVSGRSSKADSLKLWINNRLEACAAEILAAVESAKGSPDWKKDGGAFVQAAEVWLKKRKWENGPIVAAPAVKDWK